MPRDYRWWLSQKRRVQKKYTLSRGRYLSPKELKAWYKDWRKEWRKAHKR